MSKIMPAHHKTVRVPFATVAKGYGGVRKIREAGPGLWEIVAAIKWGNLAPHPTLCGMIEITVMPARGVDR